MLKIKGCKEIHLKNTNQQKVKVTIQISGKMDC